jgi:MFS family permease
MQSGWALGYIVAAILAAVILPAYGWRGLFLVGIAPSLLTLWIRRQIPEPDIWISGREGSRLKARPFDIFRVPLLKTTFIASLIATSVLFAYWGLFTWMPTFLSAAPEAGGAGMSIVKSSGWIVVMQTGAFFGYILFGFLADRFGRKRTFIGFLVLAAILVPLYGQLGGHEIALMALGPFIGFFGHGYFSLFGVMLAELFPTHLRGTAQGFCFNIGRTLSALAPFTIGALADVYGIGSALALTSAFFLAGSGLILLLPETKGKRLD